MPIDADKFHAACKAVSLAMEGVLNSESCKGLDIIFLTLFSHTGEGDPRLCATFSNASMDTAKEMLRVQSRILDEFTQDGEKVTH